MRINDGFLITKTMLAEMRERAVKAHHILERNKQVIDLFSKLINDPAVNETEILQEIKRLCEEKPSLCSFSKLDADPYLDSELFSRLYRTSAKENHVLAQINQALDLLTKAGQYESGDEGELEKLAEDDWKTLTGIFSRVHGL